MSKKTPAKSGDLGITHFLEFMYEGESEWSLFAISAPIEEVSKAFAQFRKAKNRWTDVPRKAPTEKYDELAYLAAVVKVSDNPWTVIFRSLLHITCVHLKAVPQEAKELSARLKTKAVAFFSEDTS